MQKKDLEKFTWSLQKTEQKEVFAAVYYENAT